jgi:nickel/cobalt transporter (NiCoT) family protein
MRSALRSFTGRERVTLSGIALTIVALNLLGWGTFLVAVLPQHLHYRGLGVGLGVAFTAWTLGARHAFDADHIAAIDNCTRKLIADGKRPLASGFVFAIGHSSVVMLAGVGITVAAKAVFNAAVRPSSGWAATGSVAGTVMSAAFLWLIAALNFVVLIGILRVFRNMRRGLYMFPLGCVFGIGFDTASEVVLLAGTAAAATQGLPWYAVLTLPLLFAGGMTLLDTGDGLLMNNAYAWAFSRPVRKVYYNLTMTGLSVAVAFVIGGIEIVGLLSNELHLHGWLGDSIANIDLNTAGLVIVGVFLAVWLAAVSFWRLAGVESRSELATESDTP